MIKKKNKIVGLINIIFGVLMCADWYLLFQLLEIETIYYWDFSENQEIIKIIGTVILVFPILTTLLINIVYTIKNWKNKKIMICNALTIVTIILSGRLMIVLENYLYFFFIAIVGVLGIILLVLNKNESEDKKHRLLFITGIINIIVFIVSGIIFGIVLSAFDVHFANNQRNLIKNIMTLSDGKNENRPIKVKKNGKWGYIDNKGNIIVDFIYDDCAEFIEVEVTNNNKKYYIAPVLSGNKLSLITNENKTIGTFTNKEKTSSLDCVGITGKIGENLKDYGKELNLKIKVKDNEYIRNIDLLNVKDERYEYAFGDPNGTETIFEIRDISDKEEYNTKLIYNTINGEYTYNNRRMNISNKKLNINGKIYLDREGTILKTYKNGYIPICNFEKNIFGWIDLKGETHYLNGEVQILDFIDDYILVKMNNKRICFINYQGNIVSNLYREITILPNGYIVKKDNNKNVYIDKQFKEITEEYDIMDGCRAEQGILIVANLPQNFENNFTNTLPSNLFFNIVNINSGKVVSNNIEYVNGMKSTKYEAKKYNSITDNEYKVTFRNKRCIIKIENE